MKSSQMFACIVALLIMVTAGFFIFGDDRSVSWHTETNEQLSLGFWPTEEDDSHGIDKGDSIIKEDAVVEETDVVPGDREQKQSEIPIVPYVNTQFGFSLKYPQGYTSSEFEEGGGNTILIQKGDNGFQIFVLPWDEDGEVVTPQRIKQDLPNLVINSPQVAILHDGKRALIFEGDESGIGKTREVWIIHREQLYQITAPIGFDTTLSQIMASWEFN